MTTFKDASSRFGVGQAGGDPPLTIFGLHAASTTLPTAASTGTATGGTSSSFTSLIGTATGYGELWGLGNAGAWAAGGSLPAPDGQGWILDSALLEGQLLQAGTFTMTHRLATSAAYTTFTATLYGRVYKYNGGTYTQIGPTMSAAANLTTTTTVYTLSATMPNTYFGTGDKLYFDTFLQITASTGGVGTTTVRVSNSSDATFGVANQAQLVTAGYLPGNARDAASRLRLLAATSQSLSSRFRLNQPSALTMAWMYPGSPACNAPFEYADGRRIDVLKPQYYALQSDGTLVQNTVALSGCNGYSAANATDIKKYSTQQFVTISGLTPGMDALATDSTKTTNFINTLTAFLTANGFTGIELDFEGFGLSSMSATQYADYKTLVTTLGNALHASGFKLMIVGPAIFNATYQGFYRWHWEDFDTLPVDYLVVLCYDFQFDNGSGTAVAPLATITSTCTWMQSRITDPNRIVIGLNSYGYHGPTGSFSGITIDTQVQSQSLPGFGTATRDAGSGEMMWATGGVSYDYSDTTTLDGKRAAVYATGLRNISVWHLGGNQWFSNVMANTASRFRLSKGLDALSRLHLQSGLIPHDLRSRLRLLATKSVDAVSRLRVQSPLQKKDAQSRLRLLAIKSLDAVARYRLLATRRVDSMGRFRQQSGVFPHDSISRFRVQSATQSKDSQSRFRLVGSALLGSVMRLRLLVAKSADTLSRFRQLATKSVDMQARYLQRSGLINRDLQARLRLLATTSRDVVSRLRVQSTLQSKDAQSRLRLLAIKSLDAVARYRLLTTKRLDAVARYRLLVTKSLDSLARFRLGIPRAPGVLSRFMQQSGTTLHDLQARFRLQQLGVRSLDILSRFRLQSGTTYRGAQARFALVITPLRDVVSRLRVQSTLQKKDAQSRFRQLVTKSLDAVSRLRVQSAQQFKDSMARYRLLATRNTDQPVRFRQQSTVQSKGAQSRYRQLATKSLDALARLRLQSSVLQKDARIRFTLLAVTSVSVVARLRVQSALVARDTLSRFRLQIAATRALDAITRYRLLASKSLDAQTRFRLSLLLQGKDAAARFSLTAQTWHAVDSAPITVTFRDGVAELAFRDGVAELTFY